MKLVTLLLTSIKKYWLWITFFNLTIITVLSLSPLAQLPPVPGNDKTLHLIAYAALMFPTALKKPNYWWAIALGFAVWSGAIELLQPYVNRYGEFKDLLANIIGLVLGCLLARLVSLPFNQ